MGETCGQSRRSVRPGEPHIVAHAHGYLSFSVSEGICDDDLSLRRAVVHPYRVGVRCVFPLRFYDHSRVGRELDDGDIDEVFGLDESGEMDGERDHHPEYPRQEQEDDDGEEYLFGAYGQRKKAPASARNVKRAGYMVVNLKDIN